MCGPSLCAGSPRACGASHRENYYTFRDETGEIRVEIAPSVWQNRQVGPDTKVRLLAEVDRNLAGTVYLWVKSLTIIN